MADLVADELRDQVLSGHLGDGSVLPRQEALIEQYGVSRPSLREALRILETVGLLTINRGNTGGAVVQHPQPPRVGYLLAMVIQSRNVAIDDVVGSLAELESLCAAMAARRADRVAAVEPLRASIELSRAVFDDTEAYVRSAHEFHEGLVRASGNQTLIVLLGAVEALWSAHVEQNLRSPTASALFYDLDKGALCLSRNVAIAYAFADGDAIAASDLTRLHMNEPPKYTVSRPTGNVRSAFVRDSTAAAGHRPVP
jgi:DNA-binding FadR family transcriptional regulator